MATYIHDGRADPMVIGTVLGIHSDSIPGRAGTTDHRTEIVSDTTIENVAGGITHTVQHASNSQLAVVRRGVVGGEAEDIRLDAGVA
ncbi:hypothetical protein, partial [Pseudomonas sp. NBRC 111135]|uniref:hypothetical protein n=1 Tax=Pseudomonas sp. NBRC 111135 TaxID=1661050 RepID=UPI001C43E389